MRDPIRDLKQRHALRRRFLSELWRGLHIVWPILSAILVVMLALGAVIGRLEGWSLVETIYFTFVTGLTIGYGDLVPKLLLTRILTIGLGFCGLLLTALLAAIAVRALTGVMDDRRP